MIRSRRRLLRGATHALLLIAASAAMVFLFACQSGPPPTPLDRAHIAFAEGRMPEAAALYEEAARTQPGRRAEALHGLARLATVNRQPERALSLYTKVAQADRAHFDAQARSDYAQALLLAGESRLGAKKFEPAIAALEALRKIDPDYPGASKALGAAYTGQGDSLAMHGRRTEAMQLFEQAMSLRPQDVDAWIGAAEILIATDRKQEALELLANARHYNPSDGRVRALTVQAMGVY